MTKDSKGLLKRYVKSLRDSKDLDITQETQKGKLSKKTKEQLKGHRVGEVNPENVDHITMEIYEKFFAPTSQYEKHSDEEPSSNGEAHD